MLTISETYDYKFSEAASGIWESALSEYDISDIERALQIHISDTERGERRPHPATIIRHIQGTVRTRSENAAAVLVHATTRATDRHGVSFPDPLVNAAVAQTHGWSAAYFCIVKPETCDDYLEQFKRAYERLSMSPSRHPAYLPGRNDDETFVVIGDEAAVDQVVRTGYNPKKPPPASYSSFIQLKN